MVRLMKQTKLKSLNRLRRTTNNSHRGFVLPVVITVGLIMFAGSSAMLARSFGGLIGSTRLEQSRQAKAIAEAGLARTIEGLNRDYNYLLINCYSQNGSAPPPNDCINTGTWGTPSLPSSICSDATQTGTPALTSSNTNPTGDYVIDYYAYSGTQFYGGTGRLRVIGYRKNADKSKILATAAVEMSFDVKPKPCNCRFGDFSGECSSSGFPGLLGSYINLGNNDVKGATSGNVLCTRCTNPNPDGPPTQAQAEAEIGAKANSDVDGQIFLGPINIPPVPTFPEDLIQYVNTSGHIQDFPIKDKTGKKSTENTYFIQSQSESTEENNNETSNNNYCATDASSPPVTHCRINTILLSGKERLEIDTSSGPVRLYVEGLDADTQGGEVVKAGGNTGIIHDGSPGDFSMFGLPLSADPKCSNPNANDTIQTVTLAGTSQGSNQKAANMFVYFPCATVGINGGSGATADCDEDGECGGGDISGAVWAKTWDGSSSKNAQLVVPKDMGSQLFIGLGTRFGISVQDYVALGVNSWSSFQKL